MSKISELGPITGANTRSEDLFVIVNLVQGDDGTKNITRKELVQAIQYEIFDRITITGGNISGVRIFNSNLDNVVIDESDIEDTDIIRSTFDQGQLTNSTGDNLSIVNSTFDDGDIANSTFDEGEITNSTFTDGAIFDSTANNVAITESTFTDGAIFDSTANNVAITESTFTDGDIFDSNANNITITESTFTDGAIFDSTANNIVITDSTANNVAITQSTFDAGSIFDSFANNIVITNSSFQNGSIEDSTANNVDISSSTFDQGQITSSVIEASEFNNGSMDTVQGDAVDLANSSLIDSIIEDSTANNIIITNSNISNTDIANSDFSDGTGNNNIFTNTIVDQSLITNSEISNTSFTGTMNNVEAVNLTITSSSASNTGISQSTFDNGSVTESSFNNGVINQSRLVDFDMDLSQQFDPPIDENSYFAIKNAKTGEVEQITYGQLYDEISKKTSTPLKVNVDASSGDDSWPGTTLQPVRTLERAFEICLEKAGGTYDRNAVNNAVHISVGPGTYYTKGNLKLPDDCVMTSTAGQYATVIEMLPGYESNNGVLVGSGCYVQGFSFQNFKVDNFDYPEGGFGIAYRPGAKLLRSPYIRDCSQLSNFLRQDVEPPLQPFNSKGTIADLGRELILAVGYTGVFAEDDEIKFTSGAKGFISRSSELSSDRTIYVRNLKGKYQVGDTVYAESGGIGVIETIGIDDFPNPLVGRGGGVVLADRRVLDPDSLYTYVLTFGATPRTQNGIGYVARDGAGVNGIGSLSIFVRCAFYALNGGQMTLNNSGTQFGDISMRAKGTTTVFIPSSTNATLVGNTVFADNIEASADDIIEDMVTYLTSNTSVGGLGYTGYDANKCERDTGIVLDGLGYDVALDTNYWGRLAGITYRSPISYIVPGEQLEETSAALQHLQDEVERIFVNANTDIIARANTSFNELLNVLENGEENMNPIIFTETGNTAWTAARELIQINRDFIRDELIDWIENNDEFFAYNSTKCRRDVTDYILPAVKYDMLLDTNYNSVTAGNAYYMATAAKVVGEQKNETTAAYGRLKDQVNKLIDANTFVGSARSDEAFDEIIDILNNGQTASDIIIFSDSSSISADKRNARKQLQANKNYIQDLVMGYINHNYFIYDSVKCKRDIVEYILPAVQRDVLLGTNFNAIQTGIGYYSATASEVVGTQLPETVAAVTFLRDTVGGAPIDAESLSRSNDSFNEIIDIMQNGTTSVDDIMWSDPAKDLLYFTPTTATYDPATGVAVITIPAHGLEVNDHVVLRPESLTFSCPPNAQQISHPRVGDPAYEMALTISAKTVDTITVNVGSAGGYTGVHTFVSAKPGAVVKVSITANNSNANRLLQANRTFLQEEVKAYLEDNYFAYDGPTCSRDVGLIIDAVARDVATGSNFNAVFAGLAYRSGNASTEVVVNDQLPQTVAAVTWVKQQIEADLTGGALSRANTAFGEIIDIMENGTANADIISFGTAYVSADAFIAQTALQLNKDFLKAEATAWIDANFPEDFEYDAVKCARDVGYLVDSVSFDIQHGSNVAAINNARLYYDNAVSVLPADQKIPTARAFEHLADVAALVVRDELVLKTAGNAETQDTSQNAVSVAIANRVRSLFELVATVIRQDSLDLLPTPVEPAPENSTYLAAVNTIIGKKAPLQDGVIDYLRDFHNGLAYNVEKCYRDVGLIVDAITKDITYGGNANTLEAARYYFNRDTELAGTYEELRAINVLPLEVSGQFADLEETANVSGLRKLINVLPEDTRKATKAAFLRLAEVAEDIVTKATVIKSTNNGETQDTSGTAANALTGTAVKELVEIIANVVDDAKLGELPDLVLATYDGNRTEARKQIQTNKDFITEEVISFINDKYFTFDGDKCTRDVGYLIDAVKRDVLTGSNFNSVFNGLAYRSGTVGSNLVVSDQLNETVAAVEYVRDNVVASVTDVLAKVRTTNAFNEIIDIMSNGSDSADVINFGPQALSTSRLNGRIQLQNNKEFLKAEVSAFLANNYFVYDGTACSRDVGYILDAVQLDLLLGTNFNSVQAGLAYYNATASNVINNELTETVQAFDALRNEIVTNVVTNAGAIARINPSIGEVIDILENGTANADAIVWTNPGLDINKLYARQQLQANRDFIIAEITAWIDENLPDYDEAKCQRDIGYILDAVRRDLILGTDHNTITAGDAYLRTGSAYVLSNQKEVTIAGVEQARDLVNALGAVTSDATITSLFERVIDVLDGTVTSYTQPTYPTTAGATYQTSDRADATTALQTNRVAAVTALINWISSNYPDLAYDVDRCRRDAGYIIDALSHDIKYGGNSATIRAADAYFVGSVSQLGQGEAAATAAAYTQFKTIVSGYISTAPEQTVAQGLLDIIIGVINAGSVSGLPAVVDVDTTGLDTTEFAAISSNTATIKSGVITYIDSNFPVYDSAKCERDTGYIIDAISHDVQYGGNRATLAAANIYFEDNANVLDQIQQQNTKLAYQRLATVMSQVVTETTVTKSSGNLETQDVSGTAASSVEADQVLELATIITRIVDDATPSRLPVRVEPNVSWVAANFVEAESFIAGKRDELKTFVLNYINRNYDNAKCERDLGFILDAVKRDLILGTNHNTVTAANAYLRSNSAYVLNNQSLATAAAVAFVRDEVTALANITSDSTVNALFNRVINVLNGTTKTFETSTFPTTAGSSYQTADRITAATAIQTNKETIVEDLTDWIRDNYHTLVYDVQRCERDTRFILDAITHDVKYGGNTSTLRSADAYFEGTVSQLGSAAEVTATIAAYGQLKTLVNAYVATLDEQSRVEDLLDEVIDFIGGTALSAESEIDTTGLTTTEFDAITSNEATLLSNMITYVNTNFPSINGLGYDIDKCERDVGYLIDSVSFDIQHGGNTASINNARIYFENAVSVLPQNQKRATAAAFAHLADVAGLVAAEIDVTPSPGNSVTQDKSGTPSSSGAEIEDLINIVTNAVLADSLDNLPAMVEPTLATYGAGYQTAFAEIQAVKATQQSAVIPFLAQTYNLLPYNEAKCRRDTGYIIDAISHDIQYGGNAATLNAAGIYFENAVNVLPVAQRQATKRAFTHLGEVINMVCREMEVTPSPGNTLTQSYRDVATNPLTGLAAKDLALIIANVVDDSSTVNFPPRVDPYTNWVGSNFVSAKEIIESGTINFADLVIDYLSTQENALSFPAAKCRRDIGYLIDAISHDVQYDGNHATRIAAGIYFENGISVLPVDTRVQTADVYAYLGTVVEGVVQEIDTQNTVYTDTTQDFTGTPASSYEGARAKSLIGVVEDVIRADSLAALPDLVEPDTSWVAADLLGAAQQIEDNKQALAIDMTDWLKTEFEVLDYNRDKCYRDIGYLLDAFSFDLNYGGNTASRWNADFYYWNNKYRIPEDQRVATAKSYRQLGRICADIVVGKYPGMIAISELGTEVEAQKVQDLANIFYKTQINNSTEYLAAKEEPDYSWVDRVFTDSQEIILLNKEDLAFDTVRFVNSTYRFIDINLTRRDARNLLTAIQNDFRFINTVQNVRGSQLATRTYTAAFFDFNGKHVFPVFNPTTPGLKYQNSVVNLGALAAITGQKLNHAYIVATDINVSKFTGNIYYWDGSTWVLDGANNTELLESFVGAWERMRDYIVGNISPDSDHSLMVEGLFNDVLIGSILKPNSLVFGSLVESIAHQFNGASAGVNRNALPLNFRNLGSPISASASVLSEDGGRVRWSGSDELNNQFFARGLKINGRTGRIEGRPFTSSVRKLARRASNSRAVV
jgi:hypothetical protein